ncbi:hypothetical protein [Alteribacillus bidgolensis]|uniref:Uncharacterized protein n=1 Tax=Alteribacillus bidgolensis TaxID=930129 RepID=A0A1G8IQH8_9BACI|nr:hypothetical protein [Alteribacillus bidgolensis]SDI21219.1 hypothetical protein SAMN05216352_105300 [Alteribacillus bidgolensis]
MFENNNSSFDGVTFNNAIIWAVFIALLLFGAVETREGTVIPEVMGGIN